jgi:proline iminopeptidase
VRDTELFFDVDGAALVVGATGMRERPSAFLVHGGPGVDHTGLKARYGRLADRMQLIYFDQRGHGRSARGDPRSYTLDENVEDLEALRRYLGLGPIVSIGTSYGGMVSMAHAARYPDAVSHLVLIATVAHSGYADLALARVSSIGTPEQVQQCEALFAGKVDSVEKMRDYFSTMGALYSKSYDPVISEAGLRRAILSPEALNHAHGPGGFLRSLDLRPELAKIRAPTLILAGRHDWISPPEFSEELQRLILGSDLRIFEDSAHTIGGDEQQQLLDAIIGFLVYQCRPT